MMGELGQSTRRRLATAGIALVVVAGLTSGCQTVKVGTRCRTTDYAQNGAYVMRCVGGHWQRFLTKQQAAAVIGALLGKRSTTTTAPVTEPPTTTTTLPATTTTTMAPPVPTPTSLVSVADDGSAPTDGGSLAAAVTPDGRYAVFSSSATNLVPGDATSGAPDVFERDLQTGATTLISVATGGSQAASGSVNIAEAVSDDGRYVLFNSTAANVVQGDTNSASDLFVRDTVNGTTTQVSVSTSGTEGNAMSGGAAMSADGRYVAFWSGASNLVASDTNGALGDVFVRDTVAHTTTLVSLGPDGTQFSAGASASVAVSADGRWVAFVAVPNGGPAGVYHVYERDLTNGLTTDVTVPMGGTVPDGSSGIGITGVGLAVSDDGRYVAFDSDATNLVPGDTNHATDVFVRDTQTTTITRISVANNGDQAASTFASVLVGMSGDGQQILFDSDATNLDPGGPAFNDFERDLRHHTTTVTGVSSTGAPAQAGSTGGVLSRTGRYVLFNSTSAGLVNSPTVNGMTGQVYLHDRGA